MDDGAARPAAAPAAPLASSSAVRRLVLGLLVVVVDLRLQGFDVLVDAVGWIVVVGAVGQLSGAVPGLRRARVVAVLAGVLSLADLLHPTRTTVDDPFGDGSTTTSTTSAVAPDGLQGGLVAAYAALCVVFLVLVCLAMAAAASRGGQQEVVPPLPNAALVSAVVQGAAVLVGILSMVDGGSPVTAAADLGPVGLLLSLAGFVSVVWVLVLLWGLRVWPLLLAPSDTAVRPR